MHMLALTYTSNPGARAATTINGGSAITFALSGASTGILSVPCKHLAEPRRVL